MSRSRGAALEAGLPVVVDKPLAATAAEAEELAALADRSGLLLSVFQNRRWDNDFLTLRQLLADGALGEVRRFESRFERWRPQLKGGWRESGDPAEIGGLLYDLGSHLVDQALTLFGPVASVYAEVDLRRPGARTDDDTFIALRHASGVRSHLWMSATTAQLGPRFRVLGSRAGYVKYGLDPQEAALREGLRPGGSGAAAGAEWGVEPESAWGRLGAGESPLTGGEPVPTLPGDYPAYYAAIATALRDGGPPPVTATEAAAALSVLEAARGSAAENRTVWIEETRMSSPTNEYHPLIAELEAQERRLRLSRLEQRRRLAARLPGRRAGAAERRRRHHRDPPRRPAALPPRPDRHLGRQRRLAGAQVPGRGPLRGQLLPGRRRASARRAPPSRSPPASTRTGTRHTAAPSRCVWRAWAWSARSPSRVCRRSRTTHWW